MKKIEDRQEAAERQRESNRKAVKKYQENFKRINCRMAPELYQRIADTGQSVNTFIIEACMEKLERMSSRT
jgi:predicted HicB family RNase H-like nuclease